LTKSREIEIETLVTIRYVENIVFNNDLKSNFEKTVKVLAYIMQKINVLSYFFMGLSMILFIIQEFLPV